MGTSPKLIAALALVAATVGLSACGGSDATNDASTTAATAAGDGGMGSVERGASKADDGSHGRATQGANDGASPPAGSTVKVKVVPLRVSGGGSAQFRDKGADNSIANYGVEASEAELTEAAEALHSYLVAYAKSDWKTACAYLARSVKSGFERLAVKNSDGKHWSCAKVFGALFGRSRSSKERRETTEVDAISLRRNGKQSILVYHGSDYETGTGRGTGDLYAMSIKREGGAWKVGLVSGNPIE